MPEPTGLLAGRIALVTGAASGIGAATAALFEAKGATVRRGDLPGAAELALDVTDPAAWDAAFGTIGRENGGLDILVNAAGIASAGAGDRPGVETVSLDHWRRVFAVNVEGTLLGCQAALHNMGRDRSGAIVNIASSAAAAPSPALGAYGASKAAVAQLTKSVAAAAALSSIRLRCNCVMPGMAETPMTAGMAPAYRQAWIEQIPEGRFAEPGEIAHTILFLASGMSSYVNGAALPVDGGLLSRPIVGLRRGDQAG